MKRDVQTSLLEGMERPIGAILPSVFVGSNADLMAAVAPLYLSGSVLDVTYGRGRWWDRFRPDPFVFHDLALDGVDFAALPEADRSFDTVTFDPPYVHSGGRGTNGCEDFHDRYGLGYRRWPGNRLYDLILGGLLDCCRVGSKWVLVKCMEYAQGGEFHDIPTLVTNAAREAGWIKHDQIVHFTGTGPGGWNIYTVKRARRAHSYLIVLSPDNPHYGREEMT